MSRIALFFLLSLVVVLPAKASQHSYSDEALMWGHACVAEISLAYRLEVPKKKRLKQKLEECRLMWHIQLDKAKAKGIAPTEQVTKYNTLFKRSKSRRLYILQLNANGDRPADWPNTTVWENYRDTWLAIYEEAKKFSVDPGKHPCPKAKEYGGRCDNNQHACDKPAPCFRRALCGRPIEWWSQAYYEVDYKECRSDATIPADVAAGGYRTQTQR